MKQRVHERPKERTVTAREDAGVDGIDSPLEGRVGGIEVPRPIAAPLTANTSSVLRPKRKKFSGPTRSRISTFAPSSVPIVSAVERELHVAGARRFLPASEICSESSEPG